MTAATETVTVDRMDLIEAVAAIQAASMVISHVLDYDEEVLMGVRERLRHGLLPADTNTDEWYVSEPVEVEVWARSSEIEAAVLEAYSDQKAEWAAYGARRQYAERIETCRAMAPRYRERGSMDLVFELHETEGDAS